MVGGRFRVQRLKLQGEHLDIYSVTDLYQGNRTVEAQAVPLVCPMGKLQKSRVRRLKRIYRSHNFQCSFNLDGRKFVISHVARSEAEWANLVADIERHVDDGESDAGNDFPALPSQLHSESSFRAPGRASAAAPGYLNYAEVATRGQRLEAQSSTSKGTRQRRRRQRRSQEKGRRDLS